MLDSVFWQGKKVFVTGHTGFKGTWLSLWLTQLGAIVTGYALKPPTSPSMFELCKMVHVIPTVYADIRDQHALLEALSAAKPEIVIHMAAQPLVRSSYADPVMTFETNVMGTVYVLDAVRKAVDAGGQIKAVINVTTDKCYENQEWIWGYRETDRLGGHDPYSSSKACSEWVTSSYRESYFPQSEYVKHGVALASARAGNVIGGGDWASDRLVPDCIRAQLQQKSIIVRSPDAIRPWQHVLEPLCGYLLLAQKMVEQGADFAEGWNFGPDAQDERSVIWVVKRICSQWPEGDQAGYTIQSQGDLNEANQLRLDSSKARKRLSWRPRWNTEQAIDKVLEWIAVYRSHGNLTEVSLRQIMEFTRTD
ncbi:CDP-glucose 4,6-dehydratase [Paenibacillus eucommiae]|nr:CDP-glucose 4,6-dehydratase [Paenibacillus eucommiae]